MILLAIEGGDGAGKRTLAESLARKIEKLDRRCCSLSFPAYNLTLGGSVVGDVLNGTKPDPDNKKIMALMFSADRVEMFSRLSSQIERADFLIVDRYIASNAAYHSALVTGTFDIECVKWIRDLEIGFLKLPRPSLNIYLATDTKTSRRRQSMKGDREYTALREDLFEREDNLQEAVREVYGVLAESDLLGPWLVLNPRINGVDLAPDALADQVLSYIGIDDGSRKI